MRGALRAGGLPPDLAAALEGRVVRALEVVDSAATPALKAAVTTVKAYRDGQTQPVYERTFFDLADLAAQLKKANANYILDEFGVVRDRRTNARVGYVEITVSDAEVTLDVTRRLLDSLSDAREASA